MHDSVARRLCMSMWMGLLIFCLLNCTSYYNTCPSAALYLSILFLVLSCHSVENISCVTKTCCIRSQTVNLGYALTSAAALSLHQPVQTYRYTLLACPIVIQMLGWWLKCLSLLSGACKGITAEGKRHHPNFDMENHICELPNNIIYRELNIAGKTFPAAPSICCLGLAPCLFPFFRSSKTERREG